MTEVSFADAGPVHALELWDGGAAPRLAAVLGHDLPSAGRSAGREGARVVRQQPLVWLLDGAAFDWAALTTTLADAGAITAIGGGLVRVRLAGPGWRHVLMHDAVFDAESADFGPGSSAATVIAHVAVMLHVTADDTCEALVPASLAGPLIAGWETLARRLD